MEEVYETPMETPYEIPQDVQNALDLELKRIGISKSFPHYWFNVATEIGTSGHTIVGRYKIPLAKTNPPMKIYRIARNKYNKYCNPNANSMETTDLHKMCLKYHKQFSAEIEKAKEAKEAKSTEMILAEIMERLTAIERRLEKK